MASDFFLYLFYTKQKEVQTPLSFIYLTFFSLAHPKQQEHEAGLGADTTGDGYFPPSLQHPTAGEKDWKLRNQVWAVVTLHCNVAEIARGL